MKKLIRLNGKAILNLSDMQHSFDAPALIEQADTFLSFAKTHCLFLPAVCEDRTAAYVTKNFWYGMLEAMVNGMYQADADECFVTWAYELAQKHAEPGIRKAELLADIYGEMTGMMLPEKLDAILDAADMDDTKALMLLAVCELCEMDAREQTFAAEEPAAETEPAACADGTIVVLYSAEEQAAEAAAVASADGICYADGWGKGMGKSGAGRTLLPGKPPRLRQPAGYGKNDAPPDASCMIQMQEGRPVGENTYRMRGRRSDGVRTAA